MYSNLRRCVAERNWATRDKGRSGGRQPMAESRRIDPSSRCHELGVATLLEHRGPIESRVFAEVVDRLQPITEEAKPYALLVADEHDELMLNRGRVLMLVDEDHRVS
jgi:hypothetical protein